MARSAARQFDLFPAEPDPFTAWFDRLTRAFADPRLTTGFLPLAEEAVAACPGAVDILLMAATAALLDGEPQRALVFLKRFSKRVEAPAHRLLLALANGMLGRKGPAELLLRQDGTGQLREAIKYFPGGATRVNWLSDQLASITREAPPARLRRPGNPAKVKPRSMVARPAGRLPPRGAPPRPARAEPPPATALVPLPAPLPEIEVDIPVTIEFDAGPLVAAMKGSHEPRGDWFSLRERFNHLALAQGFDELLCLPHLTGVEPLTHQIETVRKVLKQFRGRVLLADEVGLGKTIEAGMVLKEYALRGMAERVLVLTPASLVGQWQEELATKFGLAFTTTFDPGLRDEPEAFWAKDRVVASLATARRREHAERLAARHFDIVIVDEAHHLRDRASQSWKLVDSLNKRFLLLLSATPVQNDLVELYNLLTLLKPGIFKTPKEFRSAYMISGKPRQPANADRLRALMRGAMIRNTRAVVALKLPRRHAATIKVDSAPGEADAYAALATAIRRLATLGEARQRLSFRHLLVAAGSSPAAGATAIARFAAQRSGDRAWAELCERWAAIATGGKEAALIELLERNPTEKKLVFVHSRETLAHLAERLEGAGMSLARFDGSMSGPDKDAAIVEFREHASVLLCTQSGGEGRNIQFCNTLINFDVPWNPMAIEQRIGRIDRIGQKREVFVFNLVTKGTIEEQVLMLLDEKISMFELVVGEVGAILGGLEEEREFPELILDAWLNAADSSRREAFDALGDRLLKAREAHDDAKALDENLFGEDFEAA
jgi:superfamily II DNA or RNA helicase